MKGLSLWQPWATLVAVGAKLYETRSWSTGYRGPIAIHAAKRWALAQRVICLHPAFTQPLAEAGYEDAEQLPRGAFVAIADLVTIYRTEEVASKLGEQELAFGDYSPGRFAWELANIRRIKPVSARGYQGLWGLSDQVEHELTALAERYRVMR